MADSPLVSVIIDNYNYGALLRGSIDSALAQSWPRIEVVVVDDGSTDGSREIIAGYGDRIRPILQENGGQASAFNAGVAASRGEILCFLDSDDVWLPTKVERVVRAFEANPSAAWLRHRLAVVDPALNRVGVCLPWIRGSGVERPVPRVFIEGRVPVLTSAVAVRRELAERIFPFPLVTPGTGAWPGVDLKRDADAYLAFKAAATGEPFLSLDEVLGLYRRHGDHHYAAADYEPIIRRQIALAAGVSSAFTESLGRPVVPTSVYKLEAVLAGLAGRPPWSRERLGPALRGLRHALPLLGVGATLFLRQTAALGFAYATPRLWLRKLFWHQGFLRPEDAAPATPAGGQ